ncbi:MAG: PQQ-binding-like beta-propeller repeat protein [Luteimonas sp.]
MRVIPCWLLVVACFVTQANAHDAPATMFQGDATHSGVYASTSADWIDGVRFAFKANGAIRSAPAVDHGMLYFGASDGMFYALDAKTGIERWSFKSGGAITSSPGVANGLVYFSSRDGTLYALSAADGTMRWQHRFSAELGAQNYWDYYLASPTLAEDDLFIGSGDGHVYAFDAADGRVKWAFDAGARVRSTVAVAGALVVFGTMDGRVRALNRADGTSRWSFATKGASNKFDDVGNDTTSVFASPTIAGDIVAVGARDGFLYGIDLKSGKQRWRTTHDGSSWILSTAYDGKTLFVGSGSALLVQAADPRTGKEIWRAATRNAVFGAVTLAGNTVLFSDFGGTLYAVDKTSGAMRWQFPIGGRSLATPVTSDGVVYCGSDNGTLFALNIAPHARNASAPPRRIVYREGMKSEKAYAYFKNGIDTAMLESLKGAGYEQLDAAQLAEFMRTQASVHSPSVVVFSDNKVPTAVVDEKDGKSLLRRYLDAGGKAVFLGPNPLAYRADPNTGEVTDVDFDTAGKPFDIVYPAPNIAGGFYASAPTVEGNAIGLRSQFISYFPLDDAAQQNLTVLARDEFGKASAWLKSYGGAPGTGLLQLNAPRQSLTDFTELQAAIEYGVMW